MFIWSIGSFGFIGCTFYYFLQSILFLFFLYIIINTINSSFFYFFYHLFRRCVCSLLSFTILYYLWPLSIISYYLLLSSIILYYHRLQSSPILYYFLLANITFHNLLICLFFSKACNTFDCNLHRSFTICFHLILLSTIY